MADPIYREKTSLNDNNMKTRKRIKESSSKNIITHVSKGLRSILDAPTELWDSQSTFDTCTTSTSTLTASSSYSTSGSCSLASNFQQVLSVSSSKRHRKRRRQVRFAGGHRGCPVTLAVESTRSLSIKEKDDYWWKEEDYRSFRAYSKRVTTRARKSDYMTEFSLLYKQCAECKADQNLPKNFAFLCETSARGLEVFIFDPLLKDRRTAVREILSVQRRLPNNMRRDEREAVLSATARILSRQTKLLARVLGNGDAETAAATYKSSCRRGHVNKSAASQRSHLRHICFFV